jgi:prolipoprotein diacylglyceryltransferase
MHEMDTMVLEATMRSAMEQMGLAAIHWYGVIAVITAVLLSVSWMAAGLLRESHEI